MVIAREDRPGDKRLVGYVTGAAIRPGASPMASSCPPLMVPAAVVRVDALPLTATASWTSAHCQGPGYQDVDRYCAPANAVEGALAGIYAQVLGLERVGVEDSFFDLGGDSLLAMRVIAVINRTLDAHLAVRTLFHSPSVRGLGLQLVKHDAAVELVPVEVLKEGRAFPCAASMKGTAKATGIGVRPGYLLPDYRNQPDSARGRSRNWFDS